MNKHGKKRLNQKIWIPAVLLLGVCIVVAINIIYINKVSVNAVKTDMETAVNQRKENIKLKINNEYAALEMVRFTLEQNGFSYGGNE